MSTQPNSTPWTLYLIECRSGRWYAGITNNLSARMDAHRAGRGAKFTRGDPPVAILATAEYPDRSAASKAEAALKKRPRDRKLAFFVDHDNTLDDLEDEALPRLPPSLGMTL